MYDKERVIKEVFEVIEREKLCFFDEIQLFVAPKTSTLYEWDLHNSEDIKAALNKNKIAAKVQLKRNWQKETAAPALQVAVYKLMADDEEYARLSTQKQEIEQTTVFPQITMIMPEGE
jgi:hypothetical protein